VRAVNRESLGKRIAKRVARNLAQFFKHFALGLLEAASDADIYVPHYETCWCPESSGYCSCEGRGMVPRGCFGLHNYLQHLFSLMFKTLS
jgi:hypothetical protein